MSRLVVDGHPVEPSPAYRDALDRLEAQRRAEVARLEVLQKAGRGSMAHESTPPPPSLWQRFLRMLGLVR